MSNSDDEAIRKALSDAQNSNVGIQPIILMHLNIDLQSVADVAVYSLGEVGNAAHDKISKLRSEGWIMFRIQTELGCNNDHNTRVYLAKMKE